MAYNLGTAVQRFQSDCYALQTRAIAILSEYKNYERWKQKTLSEGLMYDAWHCWNLFCRTVLLKSCEGCICIDGITISSRNGDNSENRIAYIFKRSSLAAGILNLPHTHPTWGDINKILQAIPILATNNSAALLSAFGLTNLNQSVIHLQKTRNFAAHKTVHNINYLRTNIYISYSIPGKDMPPHELLWQLTTTGELVYLHWLDDMMTIAQLAAKSTP